MRQIQADTAFTMIELALRLIGRAVIGIGMEYTLSQDGWD